MLPLSGSGILHPKDCRHISYGPWPMIIPGSDRPSCSKRLQLQPQPKLRLLLHILQIPTLIEGLEVSVVVFE